MNKICTKCRASKPYSEFGRGCGRDGRFAWCKPCARAQCNKSYHANRSARLKSMNKWRQKLKDEVYAKYGGYICAACGETDELALQIDHIFNNGEKHRAEIRGTKKSRGIGGERFYSWLKKNNYPAGFQILCASCNFAKARNNGVIPEYRFKPKILFFNLAEYGGVSCPA